MKRVTYSSASSVILIITGFCVAGDLIVETHPKSLEVKAGQSVFLRCIFNQEVVCVWMKNGKRVIIAGRYTMLNKKYTADRPTRNCSIEIKKIQSKVDSGNWSCSSAGTDSQDATFSNVAVLTILNPKNIKPKKLNCVKKPAHTVARIGNSATLTCRFNQKINCNWKRNGIVVNVTGRYRYKSLPKGNSNPKAKIPPTKDCSIEIKNVSHYDHGDWICASMASDDFNSVSCKAAVLAVADSASVENETI